jgi:hypothetical protein
VRQLKRLVCLLTLLMPMAAVGGDAGFWRLTLSGHQTFLFGSRNFGGGLKVPWEVVIEFQIDNGEYLLGHGRAKWIDRLSPVSYPDGLFDCHEVPGTYLDRNLVTHATPRVRLAAFPVAGALQDGRVQLKPGYESPGNYVAVTYECETGNPRADSWFPLAERGKQVLGKRQDVETRRTGDRQWVRVREVGSLPPEAQVDLPLQHGWTFERGERDGRWWVRYLLERTE